MEPNFSNLTDREILIITCKQTFDNSERLDSHAQKIRQLEVWRNYVSGGIGVLAALIGWLKH